MDHFSEPSANALSIVDISQAFLNKDTGSIIRSSQGVAAAAIMLCDLILTMKYNSY